MTDFSEKFKNYRNSELLKIIDNPTDYQPIAVVTAKSIFSSRQLSSEELESAKTELDIHQQEIELKNKSKKIFENKIKDIGSSLIDNINPIQATTRTAEKTILILCIVLGALSLKKFYNEFGMLKFMFTDSEAKWDISMLLYFFPLVILPLGTILFWRRIKFGWSLLTVYLAYVSIGAIIIFIGELNVAHSSFSALDNLAPTTSPMTHLWSICFNGGILFVICKDNIRSIMDIDKRRVFTALGIAIAMTALTMVGIFM